MAEPTGASAGGEDRPVAEDLISAEEARTLGGLFRERVRRTPEGVAYRYFDRASAVWRDLTWRQTADYVARWQAALEAEDLQPGERVAIMLRNSPEWVAADQAALGLGLVVVPLYVDDNPGNMAYMLEHSGARVLVVRDAEAWRRLAPHRARLGELRRVVAVEGGVPAEDSLARGLQRWLVPPGAELRARDTDPEALATIIYTSGTTGRPKGVMLSHRNLVWNAWANACATPARSDDLSLSFLPLAHVYERTSGYYLAIMTGATVAYNRSVAELLEDLQIIRPTVLLSVPRIYERLYVNIHTGLERRSALYRALFRFTAGLGWQRFEHRQGRAPRPAARLLWPLMDRLIARRYRAIFGGRLRLAVSGGAPLSPEVARLFIGLGLNLIQGYGLTEASPTVSVNRDHDNDPASAGTRLPDVQIKMQQNGELLVRGPGVMMGYWMDPDATAKAIDELGWLHTGDKVSRIERNRVYLTGRFKEIIVMSNGEKTPPTDMEQAILLDPLFEQVMVVGEGRPYLAALVVLDGERRAGHLHGLGLEPADPAALRSEVLEADLLRRIARQTRDFPHYAQVRRVAALEQPWTVQNGLLTPTMKVKRRRVLDACAEEVERLYEGHARVELTELNRNVRVAG